MKAFNKKTGWLFPLQGGPLHGVQVRLPAALPYPASHDKVKRTPVEYQNLLYAHLQEEVGFSVANGPAWRRIIYDRKPALDKNDVRKQATGAPKTKVPAYEYVYRETAGD